LWGAQKFMVFPAEQDEAVIQAFRQALLSIRSFYSEEGSGQPEMRPSASNLFLPPKVDPVELDSELVVSVELEAMRAREKLCPDLIRTESRWKVALAIALAEMKGRTPQVKSVALDAHLPHTTTLRALERMERENLVRRIAKEGDKRVVLIGMTEKSRSQMMNWIAHRSDLIARMTDTSQNPSNSGQS
jgi:DNA-binding MarR family transcriptional regulator